MRMKLCPFCAEPIQEAAIICRHCQRDVPALEPAPLTPSTSRRTMVGIWAVLGAILVGLAGYAASTGTLTAPYKVAEDTSTKDATERDARVRIIDQARQAGIIKNLTCAQNEAQVPFVMWLALDADTKRNMTVTLAAHCSDQRSGNRIQVIDAQSGRELARFDAMRGYAVK